ncbi:outer membrane beta-barrel domain-containing protein [Teredinibacter sp. KSP-S5-2]|uniref:outer membrane beta-barrel domain-containing protein n=1 Tax=Teredinibacter sp. KSP-S5-2 TaxID=3034506 RepID=UPI002934A1A3|nr:outer membrane beta-barrel domain-containing protein [Teredinibacter sp. KSP-S5-2]WNO10719.1 outer membrane beta-barrel domain-containing protein [Teredinibacter sp. KSP-S5-2]
MLNYGRACPLLFFLATSNLAIAGSSAEVLQPEEQSSTVKSAAIDTEKFELGLYTGLLSVEDFSTKSVSGISFSYHINSRFLAQVQYGESDAGEPTAEKINEGVVFVKDKTFSYYSLLGGYKLFPGTSFTSSKRKFDSDIYLLAGITNVDFAGQTETGVTLGASYRIVLTDWLTGNLDFKDHIVQRDLYNTGSKTTQNTELSFGLNILF